MDHRRHGLYVDLALYPNSRIAPAGNPQPVEGADRVGCRSGRAIPADLRPFFPAARSSG